MRSICLFRVVERYSNAILLRKSLSRIWGFEWEFEGRFANPLASSVLSARGVFFRVKVCIRMSWIINCALFICSWFLLRMRRERIISRVLVIDRDLSFFRLSLSRAHRHASAVRRGPSRRNSTGNYSQRRVFVFIPGNSEFIRGVNIDKPLIKERAFTSRCLVISR